jgi:peptide/nickel transport system substrate-binding protein
MAEAAGPPPGRTGAREGGPPTGSEEEGSMRRTIGWRGAVAAAAATIVLAACGSSATPGPGSATPGSPATSAEVPAPTEATGATPAPSTGAVPSDATLRVGWSSEPDTMNPLTTYSTEATEVLQLIYDKLIGYGTDLKPKAELAASWETAADGLSTTYHLQPNATWSDGQPVTSEDVAYTFQTIKDDSLGSYAQWLADFVGAETPDPQTVVLSYAKPQAFDPALAIPILPKHIWSTMDAKAIQTFPNDQPVGSGPFTLGEWKKGETVTLQRNDAFWGSPAIPKEIIYILYASEDVEAQALKNGDVDVLTEVPPTVWDGVVGAESVKAVQLPSFSFHHIGFNVSDATGSKGNPLLKDPEIRRALSAAVDRNQLVQIALAAKGTVGSTLIPAGLADWHLDVPADKKLDADPEKAKQILDAAGYVDTNGDGIRESKDGKPLEFRLIAIESTSVDVRAAQLFRDAAEAVGIKLDLTTMDENTLGSTVYNTEAPDWDVFVWGWDSGVPDPDYMLGVPLCSQIGGNNDVFYCDKAYDALYAQQATTLDPTARKALVDQMQQMFYDAAPYIVMWYQDKLQAYRTDTWTGWQEIPGGILFNFTRDNYMNVAPAK